MPGVWVPLHAEDQDQQEEAQVRGGEGVLQDLLEMRVEEVRPPIDIH